jgi:hypothetical protein
MANIQRIPNNQDLSWFVDMYNAKKLQLDPPYQRKSVWTTKDKKFFLDSIFNNYPCPAIFLQKDIMSNGIMYNVVDGKQRLKTIIDFYENHLALGNDFQDKAIAGKKWKDIENIPERRAGFLNYRFAVEQLEGSVNEGEWNEVFDRVNRNQKNLKEQELRHAKFNGWLITLSEEEASNEVWKKWHIATSGRQRRMKDVEFISILALTILENKFIGYPQFLIDEFYAKYDFNEQDLQLADTDEVGLDTNFPITFDELKIFKARFSEIKNLMLNILDEDLLALLTQKIMTYFYSLWGILCFEPTLTNDVDTLRDRLKEFFKLVQNADKENELVSSFIDNASGAATEVEQKKKRHDALKSYLSK